MRAGPLTIASRVALAAFVSAVAPAAVAAQSVFKIVPSLNAAIVSDSNLLARPEEQQSDIVSRVSPALDAGYRSRLWTLSGRYTIDAERFARNTSLTTPHARQHAAFDVRYQPARRLAFGTESSFATTETPGELNVLSGVTLTRGHARRLAVSPDVTYQIKPRTEGTVKYAFTEDRLAGGAPMAAHVTTAAVEHHVSRRQIARVDYVFRALDFGSDGSTRSHTVTIGWTRELTRRASLSLGGGPRVGDGVVAPELSASVSYRATATELALAYTRAQTTLIGLAGAANTDSISGTAIYGRPTSWRLRFAPGVMQTARAGLVARVYRLGVGVSLPMGRTLSVDAGYDVTQQDGDLYTARAGESITRHLMVVGVSVIPSSRAWR